MSAQPYELLAPVPDEASAPFFEGCAAKELCLQRCTACATWHWPVVPLCTECSSRTFEWAVASGAGSVCSFAVVHKAFVPRLADAVPYAVVMIDLLEGPRIVSTTPRSDIEQLRIGLPVRADFAAVDGVWFPLFRPEMSDA